MIIMIRNATTKKWLFKMSRISKLYDLKWKKQGNNNRLLISSKSIHLYINTGIINADVWGHLEITILDAVITEHSQNNHKRIKVKHRLI